MDDGKKSQLEKAGFQVGSIEAFLNLKPSDLDCVIIRHGKPIGICECLGKGKDSCKGNGWIRDGSGYQKCPFFEEFLNNDEK